MQICIRIHIKSYSLIDNRQILQIHASFTEIFWDIHENLAKKHYPTMLKGSSIILFFFRCFYNSASQSWSLYI